MTAPTRTFSRLVQAAARLLLVLFASGVAVEVVARVALKIPATRDRLEAGTATGLRLAAVDRLLDRGPDSLRRVSSVPVRFDPTLGWALKEGQYKAFDAPVTVSSQELRATRLYAIPKPAGVVRVLLIGDSFTFGDEAGDEDTFPSRLQAALPEVEVINGGVFGYAHDQMWIWLRDRGMALQPDVVLLGFVECEINRAAAPGFIWMKPSFVLVDGALVGPTEVPTPDELLREHRFGLRALDVVRMWQERLTPLPAPEPLVEALIGKIAETAHDGGARFGMVAGPSSVHEPVPLGANDLFRQVCASADATCFDARPAFAQAEERGARMFHMVHWSKEGNQLMADTVSSAIRGTSLWTAVADP